MKRSSSSEIARCFVGCWNSHSWRYLHASSDPVSVCFSLSVHSYWTRVIGQEIRVTDCLLRAIPEPQDLHQLHP